MDRAASQASSLLKSLANRHRLLVVCQLIEGERSVGELAELLGIRDSTVSQHLALMRKDGLVTTRRQGQTIWYSVASAEARGILETLYRLYCGPRTRCASPQRPAPRPRDASISSAGVRRTGGPSSSTAKKTSGKRA